MIRGWSGSNVRGAGLCQDQRGTGRERGGGGGRSGMIAGRLRLRSNASCYSMANPTADGLREPVVFLELAAPDTIHTSDAPHSCYATDNCMDVRRADALFMNSERDGKNQAWLISLRSRHQRRIFFTNRPRTRGQWRLTLRSGAIYQNR